jgi:hypothetical protein
MSASSLLISASMSCSSSPESSSAAAPFVCSPYTLVTYYHPVRKWASRDHYCHCQRFGKKMGTNLLEQIPQVGDGLCLFLHSARGPYAGITRLDRPRVRSAFSQHIPLLFALLRW